MGPSQKALGPAWCHKLVTGLLGPDKKTRKQNTVGWNLTRTTAPAWTIWGQCRTLV